VVQRSMRSEHPPSVMEELGFGLLKLVANFPVRMSGKQEASYGCWLCRPASMTCALTVAVGLCGAGSQAAFQAYIFRKTEDEAAYLALQQAHAAVEEARQAAQRRAMLAAVAERQAKACLAAARREAARAQAAARREAARAQASVKGGAAGKAAVARPGGQKRVWAPELLRRSTRLRR
jgi:hypothetical protein